MQINISLVVLEVLEVMSVPSKKQELLLCEVSTAMHKGVDAGTIELYLFNDWTTADQTVVEETASSSYLDLGGAEEMDFFYEVADKEGTHYLHGF